MDLKFNTRTLDLLLCCAFQKIPGSAVLIFSLSFLNPCIEALLFYIAIYLHICLLLGYVVSVCGMKRLLEEKLEILTLEHM